MRKPFAKWRSAAAVRALRARHAGLRADHGATFDIKDKRWHEVPAGKRAVACHGKG